AAVAQEAPYLVDHRARVIDDLVVGEPQHGVARELEPDVPATVLFEGAGEPMLGAVDLHYAALVSPQQIHPHGDGERIGLKGLVPCPPRRPLLTEEGRLQRTLGLARGVRPPGDGRVHQDGPTGHAGMRAGWAGTRNGLLRERRAGTRNRPVWTVRGKAYGDGGDAVHRHQWGTRQPHREAAVIGEPLAARH